MTAELRNPLEVRNLYGTPVFYLSAPRSAGLEMVYGATYNTKLGGWVFPAFRPVHRLVIDDLGKLYKGFPSTPETQAHIAAQDTPAVLPADYVFHTPPYEHQRLGVLHLLNNLRAGLFYSPGLGKCKITVDLHRATKDPMLILCPRVMLRDWAAEFVKHGDIHDTVVIDGATPKKKREQIEAARTRTPAAVITTYETATRYAKELLQVGYRCIVADESHRLKSPFSQRTKAAQELATRAYRRILLSGTPSLGSPFDLYGQLRFLGAYFCPEDWWSFRKKFGVFYDKAERVPKILIGYQNMEIINERVTRVCLRRTKDECLDLPAQQIIDLPFALSKEQKDRYNGLVLFGGDETGLVYKQRVIELSIRQSDGVRVKPHVLATEHITVMNKVDQASSGFLYQTTNNPGLCNDCVHMRDCVADEIKPYTKACHIEQRTETVTRLLNDNARLEMCTDLLGDILEDPTNKVILWANYTAELSMLCAWLTKAKVGHVRVAGGITPDALDAAKAEFNTNPDTRVYVGQVSGGIGVTLNAANYVIYYALPWSLEHYLQSLDRNYRIGQTRKVTVYRLLGEGTLDYSKAAALDAKVDFSTLVTSHSVCATCPDYAKRCAKYNIQLYDELCIYKHAMERPSAKIRPIP